MEETDEGRSAVVPASTFSNAELNLASRISSVFKEKLTYLKELAQKGLS